MAEIRNLTRNGETFYPLTHEKAVIGMEDFKDTITTQISQYQPIEITGDITNAPDEEDITSDSNNLLKFKNRNNLYGLGKIILRRGSSFASQVTQSNTIYVIQYNFDLNSGRINIPNGSILMFEGGTLSNGTLVCADLYDVRLVYYQDQSEILSSVTLEGNFIHKACDKDTIREILVDNSSITKDVNDVLSVKANGIQNSHLNGSVVDNSSVILDTNNKISIKDGGVTGAKLNSGIVNTDDLSIVSNKLQLANRGTSDGMGKIILRKDQSFASQLTQQNTIYVIRYDFTLGEDIAIPAGCVLEFEGGSISGAYTVDFNNCQIIGTDSGIGLDVSISNLPVIKVGWFGILPNGENMATKINTLITGLSQFVTLVFEQKSYTISSTIIFNIYTNVDGNPTFILTDNTTTAVKIHNASDRVFTFNVRGVSPTVWANTNNIGVLLANSERCVLNIKIIAFFTKGFYMVANGQDGMAGGCAWNIINVSNIYAALHCITIESVNDGWPNANIINGGYLGTNTGMQNVTGVTEKTSAIVFKTDGVYYANSLYFNNCYIEYHGSVEGVDVIPIDFCTYVTSVPSKGYSDISFTNCRVELSGGVGLFKIKDSYAVPPESIIWNSNPPEYGFTVKNDAGQTLNIETIIQNYDKVLLSSLQFVDKDNLNTNPIVRGGKFIACGSYGRIKQNWDAFGYRRKSVVLENFNGCTFRIYSEPGKGGVLSFLDENLNPVNPLTDMVVLIHQRIRDLYYVNRPGSAYATVISGYGECSISIINAGSAKYLVWGSEVGYARIICSTAVAAKVKLSYPLGLYGDDVYPSSIAITNLRATFNAGDKYYHTDSKTLYLFKTPGSIGNIGTVTATATSGTIEMTLNTVDNLFVGDYITVNAVDYIIRSIDTTNSKITVNKSIASALTDAAVTLTAPIYTTA